MEVVERVATSDTMVVRGIGGRSVSHRRVRRARRSHRPERRRQRVRGRYLRDGRDWVCSGRVPNLGRVLGVGVAPAGWEGSRRPFTVSMSQQSPTRGTHLMLRSYDNLGGPCTSKMAQVHMTRTHTRWPSSSSATSLRKRPSALISATDMRSALASSHGYSLKKACNARRLRAGQGSPARPVPQLPWHPKGSP